MNRRILQFAFYILHFQSGAERNHVFNQKPMPRRDERDAAGVNQCPFDNLRKDFCRLYFAQEVGERSFGLAYGKFTGCGEEIFRRRFNLFSEPAPVEAVNGFDGNNFA